MGVTSASYLILGVDVDDVFEAELLEVPVTRYHPKTGVAFQTTEQQNKWTLFGKEHTERPDFDDIACESKLEYLSGSGHTGPPILGELVARAERDSRTGEGVMMIDDDDMKVARENAVRKFKELGYEGELTLFLIDYLS